MADFTTKVYVAGSREDELYLHTIIQAVHDNHASVFKNWLDDTPEDLNTAAEAIKVSDLVIIETTQEQFDQGFQVYTAARYKKPTLVVSRSQLNDQLTSGVSSKFMTLKQYSTERELRDIVAEFTERHIIPERDLRFNMILDRRIYKYLRDTSYETGKTKSRIVRELLEREAQRRK